MISRCGGALLLLSLASSPASAQLRGAFTVGLGVTSIRPDADALSTRARVRPSLGRVPKRGWGLGFALNWFEADVAGRIVGVDGGFGTLAIRPLMGGLSYTWLRGRLGVSPSLVTGPAFNSLTVNDSQSAAFAGTRRHRITVSLVVRPGVNATYAITPRVGITAFGGYLINHPTFDLRIADVARRVRWDAGGIVLSTGIVVAVF
jgi:hypothetical protein